ncbi:MAG: calcium-binding protein, partial [Trebonia sp.]
MAGTARATTVDSSLAYTDPGGGTSATVGGTATFTALDNASMNVITYEYDQYSPWNLGPYSFTQGDLTCVADDGSGTDPDPCEVFAFGGSQGTTNVYPPCQIYQNVGPTFCPLPGNISATLGDAGNVFFVDDAKVKQTTITGGAAGDFIASLAQSDDLSGGAGDDTLIGGAGNDTIHGGPGNDGISGGAGNDQLFGDDGNDSISGGDGNDTENGGPGNNTMGWSLASEPTAYASGGSLYAPPPADST